jgi:hypothetical protein
MVASIEMDHGFESWQGVNVIVKGDCYDQTHNAL